MLTWAGLFYFQVLHSSQRSWLWLGHCFGVLLASVVADAARNNPEAIDADAALCDQQYGVELESFMILSGIETRWSPREFMSVGHDKIVLKRVSWARDEALLRSQQSKIGSGETGWLDAVFQQAREFLRSCWSENGRFWEVDINVSSYVSSLSVEMFDSLRGYVLPEMKALLSSKALVAICLPAICSVDAIWKFVLQRYVGRVLAGFDIAQHEVFLPALQPQHAEVHELTDWSKLSLDFVIAGVQMCGTSSLWQNLETHPEIGFTHGLEADTDFFFTDLHRRLLPLRSHVDEFNGQWNESRPRPDIVGLRHSVILQFPIARYMLAQIPRLVTVVILCDPLGRAERQFLHFCNGQGASNCESQVVPFFGMPNYWRENNFNEFVWNSLRVGPHLREMYNLFGRRLAVLHQDRLRREPVAFYNAVAKAVGATKPFDAKKDFGRYNAFKGHRSPLCHNSTLVTNLKNKLQSEYDAQGEILRLSGESVPEVVLKRRTRCDRLEEFSGSLARCDQYTRCVP